MLLSSILHPLSSPLLTPLAYVPFIYPLPLWDYWPWLILPLAACVSVVYKSVKCPSMRRVPREAAVIFVWILIGMVAAGAALAGVVKIVAER